MKSNIKWAQDLTYSTEVQFQNWRGPFTAPGHYKSLISHRLNNNLLNVEKGKISNVRSFGLNTVFR